MAFATDLLLKTPVTRVNLDRLALYLKIFRVVRQGTVAVVAVFSVTMIAQLVYPPNLARPFAKLDDKAVGFTSAASIKRAGKVSDNTLHSITIGKTSYKLSLASVGISSDAAVSAKQVTDYPIIERLLPFSVFKHTNTKTVKAINAATLTKQVHTFVSQNQVTPINPKAELQPTGFVVKPGAQGVGFDEAKLKTMLVTTPADTTSLQYKGQILKPAVDEKKLSAAVEVANKQLSQQFTLNVEGKAYVASPDKLSAWIKIQTDETTGVITTTYDALSIKAWLAASVPATLRATIPTKNTVVDNVVVQTVPGQAGASIDQDKTIATIIESLTAKANATNAIIATTAIPVQVVSSFSATSQGISLVIANWSKAHPGMTAGVVFKELGGQSRQASLNADRQFYPASIYKLFTTLYLTTEIAQGRISPTSQILPGKTIASCMESMIVVSANDCPLAVAATYGWGAIHNAARSRGFLATSLNSGLSTSANDVANFLTGLANGSMLSPSDSSALLDRMQRQIYRSAIPAGSPGCTVADKVGFINEYWHDAAIVTCPNTKYVLVVFTQNGSPQAIKELAGQINALLK